MEKMWEKYHKSGDEKYRDELIVHYLHLVKYVVGRLGTTLPAHIKLDDLYSSGVTGLINAVERYDPSKKSKFESYAFVRIKGAIIDELRQLDWVPRSIHQKANWISTGQESLQRELGRDPTDEELSKHLGVTEVELGETLDRVRPAVLIPLNAEPSDGDDEENAPLAERIADEKAQTSFDVADRKEFNKLIEKALKTLPKQERKVLKLYYFDELMLKEIGKIMGVSESRISQIHTKAIMKLRLRLKSIKEEYGSD